MDEKIRDLRERARAAIAETAQSLGELNDIAIHSTNLLPTEAKHRSIEIDIFPTGQLRIKAHSQLDERHQRAVNFNLPPVRRINA